MLNSCLLRVGIILAETLRDPPHLLNNGPGEDSGLRFVFSGDACPVEDADLDGSEFKGQWVGPFENVAGSFRNSMNVLRVRK
jgi:hypothetical protein